MWTGYVGLATMSAAAIMPLWIAATGGGTPAAVLFLLALACFIAYTHRANIQRMREGRKTVSKASCCAAEVE